jgi:tetratricopeptide (TPR) repeat protein
VNKALRIAAALTVLGIVTVRAAADDGNGSRPEFAAAADHHDWTAAIDAARAHVAAVRARQDATPLTLAGALTALGEAQLGSGDYITSAATYVEALQLTETQVGEHSAKLFDPLRGVGFALAGAGRHDAAIPYLERSLRIARANFGVFDLRQQDLLRQLALSLTATWRSADAEGHMFYRLRVAEKAYGEGDPRLLPVFLDSGEWFLDIGKFTEALRAFQVALNIVESRLGKDDPAAVDPLRGLAATYMREQSWHTFALALRGSTYRPRVDATGAKVRLVNPRHLNWYGENALLRALQILDADPQASKETLTDTLLQTGDWFQVRQLPERALPYYQRAWQMLASEPERMTASAPLGFPVRVYYPAPLIVFQNMMLRADLVDVNRVHIGFTVMADGSVADVQLLEHDTTNQYAQDILRAVRAARFRPRFVDGEPVSTPALSHTETFRTPRRTALTAGR